MRGKENGRIESCILTKMSHVVTNCPKCMGNGRNESCSHKLTKIYGKL